MALNRNWFQAMHQDMERLLDDLTRRKPPRFSFLPQQWQPAIDVHETPQSYILLAELAGVAEEDLDLTVNPTSVVLRGQRKDNRQSSERQECHQLEIYWGPFERTVRLPGPVDPNKATATFRQGVLELILPKTPQETSYQLRVRIL